MADFREIMSRPAAEVKKPKPIPVCEGTATITQRTFGETAKKKTPYVRFDLKQIELDMTTVEDPSELEGIDIAKKSLNIDFYMSEDAQFRFVEAAKSIGIATEKLSLMEVVEECIGKRVRIEIGQRPNEAGTEFYNEVKTMRGESSDDE